MLLERLRTRTGNPSGRTAEERREVARDTAEVEPLLRAAATHVVDTRCSPSEVVDDLVRIAEAAARAAG